jgi:hypothetical protein
MERINSRVIDPVTILACRTIHKLAGPNQCERPLLNQAFIEVRGHRSEQLAAKR